MMPVFPSSNLFPHSLLLSPKGSRAFSKNTVSGKVLVQEFIQFSEKEAVSTCQFRIGRCNENQPVLLRNSLEFFQGLFFFSELLDVLENFAGQGNIKHLVFIFFQLDHILQGEVCHIPVSGLCKLNRML